MPANSLGGRGELVTVLGANGAGKSTLMRAPSGLHRAVEGRVLHEGRAEELRKDPALERAYLGEFG